MQSRQPIVVAFLLCVFSGPATVRSDATTIVPVDFGEMVTASQMIVHGTVVDVRSQTTGGRRFVESVVTVAVADALKGPAARHVRFRIPGGQIGRYRRVMVGAPEFAYGDEVVLFLSGKVPALPMPFGLSQGVYRVTRSSGRAIVTPAVPTGAGRLVRGDPARRPVTVDAFTREVRAAMVRQ